MGAPVTPSEKADRILARQHGAITRDQAKAVGITLHQVDRRLRTRRLRRAAHAVYRAASAPETPEQKAVVACLAGPPGTAASHLTAAALFGLAKPPDRPHVTVPPGVSGRIGGAVVHKAPLSRRDVCVVGTIPCTHPARALVDCAAFAGVPGALRSRRRCPLPRPRRPGGRTRRGRPGERAVRPPRSGATPPGPRSLDPGPRPGSVAEMRLIRRIREWDYPPPERQVRVEDRDGRLVGKVDVGWRDRRFGLEYLGDRHHGPRDWAHDDAREDGIRAAGWRIEGVDRFDVRPGATRLRTILDSVFGVRHRAA